MMGLNQQVMSQLPPELLQMLMQQMGGGTPQQAPQGGQMPSFGSMMGPKNLSNMPPVSSGSRSIRSGVGSGFPSLQESLGRR